MSEVGLYIYICRNIRYVHVRYIKYIYKSKQRYDDEVFDSIDIDTYVRTEIRK